MIEASYVIDAPNIRPGIRHFIKGRYPIMKWLSVLWTAYVLITGLINLYHSRSSENINALIADLIPSAGLVLFLFLSPWWGCWLTLKSIRKSPAFGFPTRLRFSAEQVSTESRYTSGTTQWEGFYKAILHRDGFMLFMQGASFVWVPASAFATPEEYQAALALIPSRLIKKR